MLLYLSERPLHADAIVDALGLARSNVSTALKKLQGDDIVRRVHVDGDRCVHLVAGTDPWDMPMRISAGHKRRGIDRTIRLLVELHARFAAGEAAAPHLRERVGRITCSM